MNWKRWVVIGGLGVVAVLCLRTTRAQRSEQARLEATIVELRSSLDELKRAPRDTVRTVKETTRVVQRVIQPSPTDSASAHTSAPPEQTRAEQEHARAEQERAQAEQEHTQAERERQAGARYERKFAADSLDPEWAGRQEGRIQEVLRAAGASSAFSEVRCRGAMCKLVGKFANVDVYNETLHKLFGLPDGAEHGGVSAIPQYAADGSMQASLYMARKGTTYAFAD